MSVISTPSMIYIILFLITVCHRFLSIMLAVSSWQCCNSVSNLENYTHYLKCSYSLMFSGLAFLDFKMGWSSKVYLEWSFPSTFCFSKSWWVLCTILYIIWYFLTVVHSCNSSKRTVLVPMEATGNLVCWFFNWKCCVK